MSADNSTLVVPQFPEIVGVLFKLIPGYPGYAADSLGRIWSCKRGKWRQLKPWRNSGRYLRVELSVDEKTIARYVHVLVLTAFSGGHPEGYQAMHHPDPTPTNNHPLNLMWGTYSENNKQAYQDGRKFHGHSGGSHHLSSLTDEQVIDIHRRAANEPYSVLSAEYHVSIPAISMIATGKKWKRLGLGERPAFSSRWAHHGSANPACKLTQEQVETIRKLIASGTTTRRAIAKEFGVSSTLIYKIEKGDLRNNG